MIYVIKNCKLHNIFVEGHNIKSPISIICAGNYSVYSVYFSPEMEKLTKQHTQNFESEKIAHKICAKNTQNHAKLAKTPKISQKRQKTFNKTRAKKPQISTAVKNQHMRRVRCVHLFPSLLQPLVYTTMESTIYMIILTNFGFRTG